MNANYCINMKLNCVKSDFFSFELFALEIGFGIGPKRFGTNIHCMLCTNVAGMVSYSNSDE